MNEEKRPGLWGYLPQKDQRLSLDYQQLGELLHINIGDAMARTLGRMLVAINNLREFKQVGLDFHTVTYSLLYIGMRGVGPMYQLSFHEPNVVSPNKPTRAWLLFALDEKTGEFKSIVSVTVGIDYVQEDGN